MMVSCMEVHACYYIIKSIEPLFLYLYITFTEECDLQSETADDLEQRQVKIQNNALVQGSKRFSDSNCQKWFILTCPLILTV